jgi:hypothetical protein
VQGLERVEWRNSREAEEESKNRNEMNRRSERIQQSDEVGRRQPGLKSAQQCFVGRQTRSEGQTCDRRCE